MVVDGVGVFDIGHDPNLCEELVAVVKERLALVKPYLCITCSKRGGHDLLHIFDEEIQETPVYDPISSYEIELTEKEKKFFNN